MRLAAIEERQLGAAGGEAGCMPASAKRDATAGPAGTEESVLRAHAGTKPDLLQANAFESWMLLHLMDLRTGASHLQLAALAPLLVPRRTQAYGSTSASKISLLGARPTSWCRRGA
jgi:hypothetical protein